MRITAHYLSLVKRPDDALARQVIPDPRELEDSGIDADPLSEETQSPAPLIVHRYPQRVIFLVSNQCAAYCRFCMRKRRVATIDQVSPQAIQHALHYISRSKTINEVILSGGDPLLLSDDDLANILGALKRMPHIRVLRIHTRVPCTWPQRITPILAQRLSAFHPLYINIHCNHPDEITAQTIWACTLLADAGIALGSQTVLLKGVNDQSAILHCLMEALLAVRVRPYYLHQLDRVPGSLHFQVPIERGLDLMAGLRGRLSGMGMPHYMIDLPGGGGKIELLPEHIIRKDQDHWLVRNFDGRTFRYPLR
jgi:lysine 2,3-aminomutase